MFLGHTSSDVPQALIAQGKSEERGGGPAASPAPSVLALAIYAFGWAMYASPRPHHLTTPPLDESEPFLFET